MSPKEVAFVIRNVARKFVVFKRAQSSTVEIEIINVNAYQIEFLYSPRDPVLDMSC